MAGDRKNFRQQIFIPLQFIEAEILIINKISFQQ